MREMQINTTGAAILPPLRITETQKTIPTDGSDLTQVELSLNPAIALPAVLSTETKWTVRECLWPPTDGWECPRQPSSQYGKSPIWPPPAQWLNNLWYMRTWNTVQQQEYMSCNHIQQRGWFTQTSCWTKEVRYKSIHGMKYQSRQS